MSGPVRKPTRRPRTSASVLVAVGLLAGVAVLVVVVPLLPGYQPYAQDVGRGLLAPFQSVNGEFFPLGSDTLGRDLLSRMALAGRVSVLIGLSAVAISMAIGVVLGLVAGFFRGPAENIIMGLADLQLAIPRVLLLIAVVAVTGSSVITLALLLAVTSWVAYGRVARAMAMSLREREFVLSATTQGASAVWNIRRHLLPNVLPQMVIVGSFELGQIIVLEASLSYLGLGIQPPLPSWGNMLTNAQELIWEAPLLAVYPGLLIFATVIAFNFLGDGLQDALDPRATRETLRSGR